MRMTINCDMGEGFGLYHMGNDAALMPHIDLANIACGFHASDPSIMHATVRLAKQHGVKVGAHPSLPDMQGFGRRAMVIAPEEVEDLVIYQVGALNAFLGAEGWFSTTSSRMAHCTAWQRVTKKLPPRLPLPCVRSASRFSAWPSPRMKARIGKTASN
jgi:lactam utilization protein B